MIELFDFGDDEKLKEFFESYLTTKNELKSLLALNYTFKDLSNWKKNNPKYQEIKNAIDEFFICEVEDAVFERALAGDFKTAEMVLKNRSANYNNKIEKESDSKEEIEDLISSLLDVE